MSDRSTSNKFSNRLINESSPYLLQHAHNPVDWHPWGDEALEKARSQNKVILISIGYSACHWCHVMEKESFENETVAKIMNENFINIKIDREERPDLDHIYMDAVQAMTGSGGWPLNVFLTPGAKPFYGGTYFPPVKAYNRLSWTDVLNAIKLAWNERQDEISAQAANLTEHLQKSNGFGQTKKEGDQISREELPAAEQGDTIFRNIMKTADTVWGGFGNTPKFPQTFTIKYLLQHYHFTGNDEALQQARLSIDKMLEGGIYDHVGGGLARYSTDNEWLAPHFEKMLYDNALLINILCDAFQITKDEYYEKAIRKTIAFVEKELMNEEGGFYAALDADSEGEEGKYYVWDKKEVDELLGVDAGIFCDFFNISETGNWEGKNILRILKKPDLFAGEKNMKIDELGSKINDCLGILLSKRNTRIKPLLDDKILLGWNALMITAVCKASAALNDDGYRKMAERSFNFLINNFKKEGVELYHTYKNKVARYPAFLDDYAYLIQACICLQEITSSRSYLIYAKQLSAYVIENFAEEETGYFYFTGKSQADVIIRKKEVYDGAVPSGNSTMAENLFYLAVIFDKKEWYETGKKMQDSLQTAIVNYPTSFANWASLMMKQLYGINEIVITGKAYAATRDLVLENYMPDKILQCDSTEAAEFPLLKGKDYSSDASVYLCKNYRCLPPCNTAAELFLLLKDLGNK
ncbi:MAG TPA: thioredoxin domain-containing protein [Ferruginibacter sp.]|nr:thioredoxin domain-containing protein [Ferruginibacter sp.]